MSLTTMEDVLHHALKDLMSAEQQFRKALPELAEAAESQKLSEAFEEHKAETDRHVERLERCFEMLGVDGKAEVCEAAEGLVEEANSLMDEGGKTPFMDLALAGGGRKVEHYEIVSYADAVEYAKALGHDDVAKVLQETMAEEKAADEKLHKIAKSLTKEAKRAA